MERAETNRETVKCRSWKFQPVSQGCFPSFSDENFMFVLSLLARDKPELPVRKSCNLRLEEHRKKQSQGNSPCWGAGALTP
jgi:hypothetical protein